MKGMFIMPGGIAVGLFIGVLTGSPSGSSAALDTAPNTLPVAPAGLSVQNTPARQPILAAPQHQQWDRAIQDTIRLRVRPEPRTTPLDDITAFLLGDPYA